MKKETNLDADIKAFIGFSVNAELRFSYDRLSEEEKASLEYAICELGGTSANFAKAIGKYSGPIKLFALTGEDDDFNTNCLHYALKNTNGTFWEDFKILEKGHMGFIPMDKIKKKNQVFGYKGKIQTEKIAECVDIIEKERRKAWRIATGARPAEAELIKALFDNHIGYRYLNPRLELINQRETFFELLKQTDVLIMNHIEHDACQKYEEINSMEDIQRLFGVMLVVITQDENGGKYLLSNGEVTEPVRSQFKACADYITPGEAIYPTGAGDWFGGSLISYFIEIKKSARQISKSDIEHAIAFATRVAGKKVTMPGAGNGPERCDL